MDNQRQQHYLPGPPPPPGNQGMSYLPPPPPRQQMNMPPPPPAPYQYPAGTVMGYPGGWNQTHGRPGVGHLPPPPPMNMNMNQSHQYNMMYNNIGRQQNSLPPPPPRDEMPLVSATFIPGGDSFGPGVGIPPLDDFSTFSGYDGGYDPSAYADQTMQRYNSNSNSG